MIQLWLSCLSNDSIVCRMKINHRKQTSNVKVFRTHEDASWTVPVKHHQTTASTDKQKSSQVSASPNFSLRPTKQLSNENRYLDSPPMDLEYFPLLWTNDTLTNVDVDAYIFVFFVCSDIFLYTYKYLLHKNTYAFLYIFTAPRRFLYLSATIWLENRKCPSKHFLTLLVSFYGWEDQESVLTQIRTN